MISKKIMEKAEARCLELVNDGPIHAGYSKIFQEALGSCGVEKLRKAVVYYKKGMTYPAYVIGYDTLAKWTYLRDTRKFHYYENDYISISFGWLVFGLVLEHWLSSNAPAEEKKPDVVEQPLKFKVGDIVRIMVSHSRGGSDKLKIGSYHKVMSIEWHDPKLGPNIYGDGVKIVLAGYYYNPEDLELVESSDEAAPKEERKFKKGDVVRVMVLCSLGGNYSIHAGSHGEVLGFSSWGGEPCVNVNGNAYRASDLQLVKAVDEVEDFTKNPCSEIQEPHYLDRAIAEQKAYYAVQSIVNKKEPVMLKIETKTFVNGAEISKLTVEQLVDLITGTETEITKLQALKSKPKKVLAKIEELQEGLARLVEEADKA